MKSLLLSLSLVVCAAPALAREVDFSAPLTDLSGQPLPDCVAGGIVGVENCKGAPPLTLGAASVHALVANYPEERGISSDERFKRGVLAQKIYGHDVVDVSAEEIAKLKDLIGKGYSPVVVVQAWRLLDPEAKPK